MVEMLNIPFDELAEYERFFFKEICMFDTGSRKDFNIPLPANERIHFACVQDTVRRLTEVTNNFKVRKKLYVTAKGETEK